jgi:choline-sulfatase
LATARATRPKGKPPQRSVAWATRILAGAAVWLPLLGCGAAPAGPPNVVVVVVDTLRADALGSYGGPTATPGFDGLAAEGVLFERAVASAPETAASHATLFTGFDVQHHGVDRNGAILAPDLDTLAEAFRAAGYSTGAFVSSFVLDPRFGWDQGFDDYDATFPISGETVHNRGGFWSRHEFEGFDRRAQATNAAAIPWLRDAREPFFLFIHYFDPHAPNQPTPANLQQIPQAFARNRAQIWAPLAPSQAGVDQAELTRFIRSYYAEVLYTDSALEGLVAAIEAEGFGDRTLIAVTADHGEGLGQHGLLDHAAYLYEEQIHVPWVLRWPGTLAAGSRIRTAVGLVDLAPTIAELAGVSLPGATDGRSVATAALGGSEPEARPLLSRRRHYPKRFQRQLGTKFSVAVGPWKYIRATDDPDELYDLNSDREEIRNLHDARPAVVARLAAVLDEHLATYPLSNDPPQLTEKEREALEALGYGSD